jgi:hypothetical protein
MFEVGKFYDFELLDETDHEGRPCTSTYFGREVLEVSGPLLKMSGGPNGEVIVNTHSPSFVRATLKDGPVKTGRFSVELTPPRGSD